MTTLRFTVPGLVVPWQRTSYWRGRKLTPEAQRDYQARVAMFARLARVKPAPGDVRLDVVAWLPDRHVRDWDNIGKTVADALRGIAYGNDHQVFFGGVEKALSSNPRLEVTLSPWAVRDERKARVA